MVYKAENIDTEKAIEYIKEQSRDSYAKQFLETQKIEQYYEGYRKGLSTVQQIFYCSNYEKEGKINEKSN